MSRTAWPASKTLLAPAAPGAFPPSERLHVVTLASSQTEEHQQADTSWTLDNLAFEILKDARHRDMSRSTINRVLTEADLKPHRSEYWLNSHDPDFDAKANDICKLYLDAPRLYEQGRLVLSSDEKTGMQILQRKYPTRPARPGSIEKREFEYIRHGTRALLTTFCVPTGQIVWNLGQTRTSVDWVQHLNRVATQFPQMNGFEWVVDNLNTHWSLDVCRWVAERSGIPCDVNALQTGQQRRAFLRDRSHKHVFHFTPIHGSWLNQVELFFSVLSRRFLKRGDFASAAAFEERLQTWLTNYNRDHAHPYRWTYTGEPLVRSTPFSQTRRQQRRGRAWFGIRPSLWERQLYPPRPYRRRKVDTLAGNL
jgi:transposase